MTPAQIKSLFLEVIERPNFREQTGTSDQQLYNYRHRTNKTSFMIQVLLKADAIEIKPK